ncbi:hypothetical protein K438DRAFT_1779395 [Mycena galopus ATCC 62051]|nr:hypothetical protein K438DRAFT_1779395 [Mycena galopus ATCC 62051]
MQSVVNWILHRSTLGKKRRIGPFLISLRVSSKAVITPALLNNAEAGKQNESEDGQRKWRTQIHSGKHKRDPNCATITAPHINSTEAVINAILWDFNAQGRPVVVYSMPTKVVKIGAATTVLPARSPQQSDGGFHPWPAPVPVPS